MFLLICYNNNGDYMENYRFGDNTIVHSIGFNPWKIESILTNGILSKSEAKENNIKYARNYFGYNFDDYISMSRPMYSNMDDINSSFYMYVPKNVSIVVENQDFIYNSDEQYFNHPDEVFVSKKVPVTNFAGIIIPDKYSDYSLRDLPMIPLKSTSYLNIKENCDLTIAYLKNMGELVDSNEYQLLLSELKNTIILLNSDRDNEELQGDFLDIKLALNEFIAEHVQNAFDKLLNTDTTLSDMVNYLNEKTLNLEMYSYSNSRKK